jgi:predicted phage terminase large subunit-like protein
MRFSTGIGGAVTGTHGGILACDDPNKAQAAMGNAGTTLTELLQARNYWNKVLPTRQVDPQTTRRLLLQQCLHYEDVINDWVRNDPEVTVLCLPAEYDAGHPFVCSEDPRTEDGELLWPEHVPAEQIAELKRTLGPMDFAAQYQQSPGRAGGEVFRLDWLSNYWKMIRKYDIITGLISCDLTFGGKRDNASYIALGVWALVGTKACLVDQVRTRASYLETRSLIKVLAAKYPWARPVLVENKANGPAVLEDLKREIAGMVPHEPKGSKLARAHAVTGYFEAGDVLLPDPQGAILDGQRVDTSWVADYVLELSRFTGSDADVSDQVDQTSQALSRFYQGPARSFVDAMSGIARDLGFA